ncbi:FKBP-type peptidyl-prolyl cis-trans isomerase [Mycolicibacterium elephantis]
MSSFAVLTASVAALALTLAACGSDTETTATTTSAPSVDELVAPSPTETAPPEPAVACPTAAPDAAAPAEWNLAGDTGNVAVTGSTETTAPNIVVDAPFSVSETQVQTLQAGDGPVVADTATVLVCYMGVNGRDGTVFDNSYERGAPVDFPLTGVVPGFQKAIAGQTVGSTVGVAMTSEDGYPEGQPAAGIQPGDSLIFAIKVIDAAN